MHPLLVAQASPPAVPELALDELVSLVLRAVANREWGLLAVGVTLGLIFIARHLGAKLSPFLGTDLGGVVLAVGVGTLSTLALALLSGAPLSLGLVISALMTAAGASGLWSWLSKAAGALGKPPPPVSPQSSPGDVTPQVNCTPREIADGTCVPR